MVRVLAFAFVTLSCTGAAIALVAVGGCITSPPPDLPQLGIQRPTILHDAVQPPSDTILAELPSQFVVPLELGGSDPSFYFNVFVDYNPCANAAGCIPTQPSFQSPQYLVAPGSLDGGPYVVDFSIPSPTGATGCHTIQFLVAHAFNATSPHTWDSVGGDVVTWIYNPGGSPEGCPVYDAGAFQDGAFPPADAASEGTLVTPESGTGDL